MNEEPERADTLLPAQERAYVEDDMPDVLLLMSKVKEARERLKKRGESYQKLAVTRQSSPRTDIRRRDWKPLQPPPPALVAAPRPPSQFPSSHLLPGDEEEAEIAEVDIDDGETDRTHLGNGENQFVDDDVAQKRFEKPDRFGTSRILPIAILIILVTVITFLCIHFLSRGESNPGTMTDASLSPHSPVDAPSVLITPVPSPAQPVTPAPSATPVHSPTIPDPSSPPNVFSSSAAPSISIPVTPAPTAVNSSSPFP